MVVLGNVLEPKKHLNKDEKRWDDKGWLYKIRWLIIPFSEYFNCNSLNKYSLF